jgi:hypothetical protein
MTAFDSAWDLLKRFVLATDSDMILEDQDLFENDNWEGQHNLKLIDTSRGNAEAGEFSLQNNEAIDSSDHLDEVLWDYLMDSENINDVSDMLMDLGLPGTELKFNENRFPEIHATMMPRYKRQRLYQTKVLPTLIDRLGGITSDKWRRSTQADKAHQRMQTMANRDYRISHRNPKPMRSLYNVDDLMAMGNEVVEGGIDFNSLTPIEEDHFKSAANVFLNYDRYDDYERVPHQYIQRGWGDLKPSPRVIPIVDINELDGIINDERPQPYDRYQRRLIT